MHHPGAGTVGWRRSVGAACFRIAGDAELKDQIATADAVVVMGQPVIVEVNIDYSKRTAFTDGAVKTQFKRFSRSEKVRAVSGALVSKITG